jgi:trimeric autotransporter adhesin
MATPMNQLTPAQQAIVNQIIAAGQQLGVSNEVIMAAVNFANAESAFKPDAPGPTPGTTIYGLYQYSTDTWNREYAAYIKANPDSPLALAGTSASAARNNVDAMIQVMYFDLKGFETSFNAGQFPTPPVVMPPSKIANLNGYNRKVVQLENSGIHIGENFLQYAYLFHNSSAGETIKVDNMAFKSSNLATTAYLVCTQTGEGNPGTGLTCPNNPDPGLAYTEIATATLTGRFYENGVYYTKDTQTGQEFCSIPTDTGGEQDITQLSNGVIVTQNFTVDGQLDTTIPGTIGLADSASDDIKAAFQKWKDAGNDPANIYPADIFFDDSIGGISTLLDSRQYDPQGLENANNAILIGEGDASGNGGDILSGGIGNDLLIGGSGDDIIFGGGGLDVMAGGGGTDTYVVDGSGTTIEDSNPDARIIFNGHALPRGDWILFPNGTFQSPDGLFAASKVGTDLVVVDISNGPHEGDTLTLNKNFQSGDFGINLVDAPADPTNTIVGDYAWKQFGTDANGNPIYQFDSLGNYITDPSQPGSVNDILHGSAADDHILGGDGRDFVDGKAGNDLIEGGAGGDIIDGGIGDDRIYADSQVSTAQAIADGNSQTGSGQQGDWLTGGSGNDTLVGSTGNDVLMGGGGSDTLIGGAGDDDISGDSNWLAQSFDWTVTDQPDYRLFQPVAGESIPADGAADVIHAGAGNDHVWGGLGDDAIYGEGGNDILSGNDGNDAIFGGSGDDIINGDGIEIYGQTSVSEGNDYVDGGDGNDQIWGNGGDDTLLGGNGNDTISGDNGDGTGAQGNDYIDGGAGNDMLYSEGGNDTLIGGDGNDQLDGGDGNDNLYGGTGDDVLYGGAGANYLDGGDGNDTLNSGGPGSTLFGGAGNDDLTAVGGGNYLDGGEGDNTLQADGGNNEMFGGSGNDSIIASGDGNYLDGGDGTNSLQVTGNSNELYGGANDDTLLVSGDSNYLDGGDGTNMLQATGSNNELYGGADDDTVAVWGDSNYLDGGDGTNTLQAVGNNNELYGGAGADTLVAVGSGNYLDGWGGNNTLQAQGGNNTLFGESGDDILQATDGNNYLDAGDGNNTLIASGGGNTLIAGAGDDSLTAWGGSNTLSGGDGNDTLSASDYNFDASGNLFLFTGNNTLDGGGGNDTLYGGSGNDTLIGGTGNDTLAGGDGNDTYVYNIGDGTDTIYDSSANGQINTLAFGDGISLTNIVLGLGSLKLDLGNGDVIHIANFNPGDALNSSSIQNFEFADGATYTAQELITALGFDLSGIDGNDVINGTNTADRITGGKGDDILNGGAGSDTYIYNLGDGADTIADSGSGYYDLTQGVNVSMGPNTLSFGAGITADMITPRFDSATRNVTLDLGNGDSINIGNVDDLAIQMMQFADGTALSTNQYLLQYPFVFTGTDSRDVITGTNYNDIIQGGKGDDTLIGGAGSDTYVYNLGDGADRISDSSPWYATGGDNNILSFGPGITPDMIKVLHIGNGCILDLGNGDTVNIGNGAFDDLIMHGFTPDDPFNHFAVQTLQFADGTTVSVKDFVMQYGVYTGGTPGDDVLVAEDLFYNGPLSYWDQIPITNRLEGGKGNDTLIGGAGSDIYVFNRGDGADTIVDSAQGMSLNKEWNALLPNEANTLSFGAGISASDITVRLDSASGVITLDLGNGDSINIGPDNNLAVQDIRFADGTTITTSQLFDMQGVMVIGTDGADTLNGDVWHPNTIQGLAGNDTLAGGQANDTLIGGTGNDTLIGGFGNDTYVYNLGDGADTIVDASWHPSVDANGQPVQVPETNTLSFGNGLSVDMLNPVWDGNALTLDLGNGDTIRIGAYKQYDSSTQYFDLAVKEMQFSDGTVVQVADFLAQHGMQNLAYAEMLLGTSGNDALYGDIGDDVLSGEAGNDLLIGGDGSDTLLGGTGNDTLDGGAGNDLLEGGAGDDTYVFDYGSGRDVIADGQGSDVIQVASGISQSDLEFKKDGVDLIISITNSADSLTIKDWFTGNSSVNTLQFADQYYPVDLTAIGMDVAAQTQVGSSGDDWLEGSIYNDSFQGGAGNDTLIGGAGNDTYIFDQGDGADTIYELSGNDTISFGAGITPDMLVLDMQVINEWSNSEPTSFPDPNADLMANEDQRQVLNIQIGTQGDLIQVISGKGAIENFQFADGSVYTLQQLAAMQGVVSVTDSNDQASQWWAGPHRTLDGIGVAADFNGGVGNDTLLGGINDDVYHFNLGDGQDVIADLGGNNEIAFGLDVSVSDVTWSYDPTSATPFILYVGNGGDSIAILNGEQGAIQTFSFADGTVLSFDQLIASQGGIDLQPQMADQTIYSPGNMNNLIVGGDGADTIYADSYANNLIVGGKGDDTIDLSGWSNQANTLLFNLGDGQDNITIGPYSQPNTLLFGEGIDPATVKIQVFDYVGWDGHQQDMLITYGGDQGDSVYINGSIPDPGEGGGNQPAVRVEFTDGTQWSYADLLAHAGADTPLHSASDQVIVADPTNPVMIGGPGSDTYKIDQPGQYLIVDQDNGNGTNVVDFGFNLSTGSGITDQTTQQDANWSFQLSSSYQLSYDGSALSISFDNGVSLRIDGFDPNDPLGSTSVSEFHFADGTVLSLEQLLSPGIITDATLADGSPLPSWMTFDPATQTFSGTPSNWDVGQLQLQVNGTDAYGNPLAQDFMLNVLNVNDAPTVVSPLQDQSAMAGQPFSFTLPSGMAVFGPGFMTDATDIGTPDQVWPNYDNYLYGSGGNDTYNFARGDGSVYISDWDGSPMDTVQFADVLPSDVMLSQDQWGDVILSVNGTGDSLTLDSWLYDNSAKIEQFVFADGTVWNVNDIQSRLSTAPSAGSDYITGSDGNDTIQAQSGDDAVLAGLGNDLVLGGAGNDWIDGGSGSDILSGGSGSDEIDAESGYSDTLNDLLDGGAGDDYLSASISNDLLVGGQGNDYIFGGDGNNIILFNRGDGNDTIDTWSSGIATQSDTISLGGGINYADLSFSRSGNDLVLNTGNGESLTFTSWFGPNWSDFSVQGNKVVSHLQIVAEAMAGYDPNSSDPLLNKRIEQFDFMGLANQFEAALAADPTLTTWQLAPYLSNFSLGGSDTTAIGGDMAYLYGKNGNLNGLTEAKLRAQLNNSAFGVSNQTLTKTISIAGLGVFNDIDFIYGDTLTYSATLADGSALPSWLTFDSSAGTFSGTPANADAGNLSVTVTATDTGGLSATSTFQLDVTGVTLVNDPPVAHDDNVVTDQNSPQTVIQAATLLANDTDPNAGDVLTLSGFDGVTANGNTITQDANGNLVLDIGSRYQSLADGQVATDSFTYTISDPAGATSTATVNVTITGTNDAPVTTVDTAAVQEDLNIVATGNVLANDSDVDQGTVLSVANAGTYQGAYGTLTLNADGSYSYALDNASLGVQSLAEGQVVTETFAYQATDGIVATPSTPTVSITGTNDAPVTTVDTAAVKEDVNIIATGNVLANDTDVDQGTVLSVANAGTYQGTYGILTLNADGTYSYALDNVSMGVQSLAEGQVVTETFAYQATDGLVSTPSTLTVNITGTNDAPVTTVDTAAVKEDVTLIATGNVLANDTDVDRGTVLSVANAGVFTGQFGTLTLNADGSYSYALDNASLGVQSLAEGQVVTETFAYQATDGIVATPSTLTVTITGTNDAPVVAVPLSDTSTLEDQPFSFTVPAGTFTDIDQGDRLAYSATMADGSALPGWLSFDAATGTFSGVPGNWDVGVLNVSVKATDTGGLSATSSFAPEVVNVNDAPIVLNHLADQCIDTSHGHCDDKRQFSFAVPANTFDDWDIIHGDSLSYTATLSDGEKLPSWIKFDAATQTFSGKIEGGGNLDIRLTATDQAGASVSQVFNLSFDKGNSDHGHDDCPPPDTSQDEFYTSSTVDDIIHTGNGADVVSFSRGDGRDKIYGGVGTDNTLILDGGIRLSDIALSKVGNDLIVDVGSGDQIDLRNWYDTTDNYKSVLNLQVVTEALSDCGHGGSGKKSSEDVKNYNFADIAASFDQALAANSGLSAWSITNALLDSHLACGDAGSLGEDFGCGTGNQNTPAILTAGHDLANGQGCINPQSLSQWPTLSTGTAQIR